MIKHEKRAALLLAIVIISTWFYSPPENEPAINHEYTHSDSSECNYWLKGAECWEIERVER